MTMFRQDIWKDQLRDALVYWLYIPGAVILSGLLLDLLGGFPRLSGGKGLAVGGTALIIVGIVIIWRATMDFKRFGDGTPNPRRPPKVLVTAGSYRLCRHPMFLGYDCAALGVVLLFGSLAMLLVSYPIFIILQIRFLQKEERYLARYYQQRFAAYQRQVPFLIPFMQKRGENT